MRVLMLERAWMFYTDVSEEECRLQWLIKLWYNAVVPTDDKQDLSRQQLSK